MNVRELIDVLKVAPMDAEVIYRRFSEYAVLDANDVDLVMATEKRIVLRGGQYVARYGYQVIPPGEVENFVTVVTLPGN